MTKHAGRLFVWSQHHYSNMQILALSGSPRPDSAVSLLLRAAAMLAPAEAEFTFYESLLSLPHFNPELDTQGAAPLFEVAELRRQIQAADAVIIATPEYAYGMPGSLKNALDWLVSAGSLVGRPVAALSASPSALGGDKAHAGLLLTLSALNAAVVPAASFPVPFVRAKLNAAGTITDAAFADALRAAVAALVEAVPVQPA
jgi:chromate reductase